MIRHSLTTAWHPSETSCDTTQQLADILDEYLEAIEAGEPLSVEQVVARYPGFAEPLREYLSGLELLHGGMTRVESAPPNMEAIENDGRRALGDYKLIREVGRGGMGIVYEARQLSLNRRVAVKVLPFAAMLDSRQIMRFENEARAAAQLHHPNIVPVYGVGCERGVHFYAMQFIDGRSLREAIDEMSFRETSGHTSSACKRVDAHIHDTTEIHSLALRAGRNSATNVEERSRIHDIARLGAQAASALHAAHQCGVIHRDIKPSNLMLDQRGQLWITDFGLARCQTNHNLTKSGDIVGTLHYMSPEQARGDAAVAGPRTDVYSLAVTLYELLTLRRPFEGDNHADALRNIELGVCKPVRHWNSSVPSDLENVILKAMEANPVDRYADAAEFEADLNRFFDGKPTHAKPPSSLQVVTRWAARNRTAVVSGVAALVVMSIVLAAVNLWLLGQKNSLATKNNRANNRIATLERNLETFGLQAVDVLKNVPGSEEERRVLLDNMLAQYDELIREFDESPSLRNDAAVTHTKMASVYRELGDKELALQAYRQAEVIFEELVSSHSNELNCKSQLAECLSSSGLILAELGRSELAASEIQNAIVMQQELIASDGDTAHIIALANSYANLGTIQDGDSASPSDSFNAAVRLLESALKDEPDNLEILHALAAVCGNRCVQLVDQNRHAALRYAQLAVRHGLTLTRAEPEVAEHKERLATDSSNLGALYVKSGEHRRAIEAFRLAAKRQRELDCRDDLVTTLCNLAKTQQSIGFDRDATTSYREAVAIQLALLNSSPGNLNYVSRLGGLYNNLAYIWQSTGDLALADLMYEMAIEYERRAFELAPHVDVFREDLSRTLYNRGRVALRLKKPREAAEMQVQRANLWPTDSAQLQSAAEGIKASLQLMSANDGRRDFWNGEVQRLLDSVVDDAAVSKF